MSKTAKTLHALTEFRNVKTANDINLWIYTMPVVDVEERYEENYKVCKDLCKSNGYTVIAYHTNLIASLDEIKEWDGVKYNNCENRSIDINSQKERILLEKVLLKDIQGNIDKNKFELSPKEGNSVYLKKTILFKQNLILKRKIMFNVNVNEDGSIIIGFDLSHSYDYINTLDKELNIVKEGDKVKDFYHNKSYEFVSIAPFTISEHNKYLGCSVIDYYKNKNQSYIVDKLNPNTPCVLVTPNKKDIFPYIPNRLKRVCDKGNLLGSIVREADKHTKLSANDKMKISIELLQEMLENSTHIQFKKSGMIAEVVGYKVCSLPQVPLLFKNENTHFTISHGMQTYGAYESKEIKVSYFIDPSIAANEQEFEHIRKFTSEMQKYSGEMGVPIKRESTNLDFKTIDISNPATFEYQLRDIVKSYDHPTVVFMNDKNCTESNYKKVKNIFGNKNNIATQFVKLSTTKVDERFRNLLFLNILLGVYGKSGLQPWILKKPLNADCYIGLDVSREKGINTAGVIQVVGKDGRVLKSKTIISAQAGERIDIDTVKDVFYEAISSYKDVYGEKPKHIVFHRDGISREELDMLEETANALEVKFDYIEVTKNVNRRIATFDVGQNSWNTEIGKYYTKDDYAYLISTNPRATVGMAKPLRIRKFFGNQDIHSVVEDIFSLSYMHIGSILKSRLPVTTYYADLSSTFGNRSLLPANVDNNELHFI